MKEKIITLFNLLDKIKIMGENDLRILYFPVKKNEINSFMKNTKENAWFRLQTTKQNNCLYININYKKVLALNISTNIYNHQNKDIILLDYLILKTKWCLKLIEENKYNDYIKTNLPCENRFGLIKRCNYWKVYPNEKTKLLKQISPEQINLFINSDFHKPHDRIKKMTANKYYKYVQKAYKSLNYQTNLNDIKNHLRNSPYGDDNLSNINPNSSKKFDKWYDDESRFGGHPFEIIRGTIRSRINLYIEKDNGYYLALNGRNILKNIEIAKIYIVLKKDSPIYLYNHQVIKKSLLGTDYIGIVPSNLPLTNNNTYFKKQEPLEFVHYNKKLLKYIEWQEIEKAYLN